MPPPLRPGRRPGRLLARDFLQPIRTRGCSETCHKLHDPQSLRRLCFHFHFVVCVCVCVCFRRLLLVRWRSSRSKLDMLARSLAGQDYPPSCCVLSGSLILLGQKRRYADSPCLFKAPGILHLFAFFENTGRAWGASISPLDSCPVFSFPTVLQRLLPLHFILVVPPSTAVSLFPVALSRLTLP